MTALLIRRRRPIGEPAHLVGAAGAGRIARALLELRVEIDDARQAVIDPEGPLDDLDAIDLGARFDVVALGSHLVNNPDDGRRAVFLALAERHLAIDGRLLLEHHPIDWAETAGPTRPMPGATLGMVEVERNPPFVSAVSVYDLGGRMVRQPFTARVLSEAELDAELDAVTLVRTARIGPTWLEARRR